VFVGGSGQSTGTGNSGGGFNGGGNILIGNGGGGGGASDVRDAPYGLTDRLLVAGGGGGMGDGGGAGADSSNGGSGSTTVGSLNGQEGGAGGNSTGGSGGAGGTGSLVSCIPNPVPPPAEFCVYSSGGSGVDGSLGQGGAGGFGFPFGGGGGGGGYYGGGGGGGGAIIFIPGGEGGGGGGGGGSDFVESSATNTSIADGAQSGNGEVTISYTPPAPDLSITNSGSPNPVVSGQPSTYTIQVTNQTGGSSASGVTVTDPLPASGVFKSMSTTQGTCTRTTGSPSKNKGGTVTCSVGTLEAGNGATITIVIVPTTKGTLSDTATVSPTDATPLDNSATATVTVTGT
jgi:uncharacterized repeat protein (TIGR01451 family)